MTRYAKSLSARHPRTARGWSVRSWYVVCAWPAALVMLLVGCSTDADTDTHTADSARGAAASETTATGSESDTGPATNEDTPAVDVTLTEADDAMYQQVLNDAKGKVVLVDFWATWCVPCKKNLPKVVGFQKEYGAQGLRVVTVSIDDDDAHDDALKFLTSIGAQMTNLRSKWGASSESVARFEYGGEVPYYKLFDRQGKLRYQFSASADIDDTVEPIEDLNKRIEELLNE